MIVLLFGPPGCGKGTQAKLVAGRYRIPAISTGEMFRAECDAGTPLGKRACGILAEGGLVGDDIVNEIVASRIACPDCASGFLLDGYPRTVPQAIYLDGLLNSRGLPAPIVIHLDVGAEVLVRRISARRQCPKCSAIYNLISQPPKFPGICDADGSTLVCRQDDTETVIRQRLKAYEKLTGPVTAHYHGRQCLCIDGSRGPGEIAREIAALLDAVPRWTPVPPRPRSLEAGSR